MTMALWSEPGTSKTLNSSTSSPRTKPWSMRKSLGMPGLGAQVGESLEPRARATATAASVNWDAVRRYSGQMGVALKSPMSTRGEGEEDVLPVSAAAEEAPACFAEPTAPQESQRSSSVEEAIEEEVVPPRAA